MADWSAPLASLMTTGSVAFMLTIVKAARDESEHWAERRRKRKAERREDEQEPLKAEQLHLGIVDQATVIQQRMIETLEHQVEELKLRYELLKTESDQRFADLKAASEAETARLTAENQQQSRLIDRLSRRLAAMALELEQYRPAPGA